MMGSTHSLRQGQFPIGMIRHAAASACLVIVHLLLIHTLHLTMPQEAPTAHHLVAGAQVTHTSLSSPDPADDDASCSAPAVVEQRFEIPLADVELGAITFVACDTPSLLTSDMSAVLLPRPTGPERQAILQRFTL